jgi:predicted dehydrogenase
MMRIIQVGVGGYGRTWLDTVQQLSSRVCHVSLVDTDAEALNAAGERLRIPATARFSSIADALAHVDADAVLCVVPPEHHAGVISAALAAGRHVLSEKPLADSMVSARALASQAEAVGRVLMVSQKGRFHPWVRRFRYAVTSEEVGVVSHLTLHYRAPLFQWGASGFRHRMDDPLLIEMSIHHFDLLRALTGREPIDVRGRSWNAPGSGFAGDIAASLCFTMSGGLPVIYEGYCRSSGDLTSWYGDIRAEGDTGTVTMVHPSLYIAGRGADQMHVAAPRQDLMRVGDLQDGQLRTLTEFVDAIEGGREPESSAAANLGSLAMLFAAVDACRTGSVHRIADYLA